MAGKIQDVAFEAEKTYSRTDYTALRAYLNKLSVETILHLYYDVDELAEQGIEGTRGLRQYLEAMRDNLIKQVIGVNPHLAEGLQRARENFIWSKSAVEWLVQAPQQEAAGPALKDSVSRWFRPIAANRLKDADIHTLGDIVRHMEVSGRSWYLPVAGFGEGRAAKVEGWLRSHEKSLGRLPSSLSASTKAPSPADIVILDPKRPAFAPFGRCLPISELDGSKGLLRGSRFPLVSARTDVEAILTFLTKFDANPKTRRSYQKEIERFLMWCILARGKAMSSAMVEDCHEYKKFLSDIPGEWTCSRRTRGSAGWAPFASVKVTHPETDEEVTKGFLLTGSQEYALTVLSTFFEYLMKMRYLSGNPWSGISKKISTETITEMHIEKALPQDMVAKFVTAGGILDQLCQMTLEELQQRYHFIGSLHKFPLDQHVRVFKAIFKTIVNTGIRREEASTLTRNDLRPYPEIEGLWQLTVLGKGNKLRTVYLEDDCVEDIRSHWKDRGLNFDGPSNFLPLFDPPHRNLLPKRTGTDLVPQETRPNSNDQAGYKPGGIYKLITSWFDRIAKDEMFDLTPEERAKLADTGVHALRHTFGTTAVEKEMPLDVIRSIMGHKSLTTTTIYTQSEKRRNAKEMHSFYAKKKAEEAV